MILRDSSNFKRIRRLLLLDCPLFVCRTRGYTPSILIPREERYDLSQDGANTICNTYPDGESFGTMPLYISTLMRMQVNCERLTKMPSSAKV